MDVYIRPKNVIQQPRMYIYILKSRLRYQAHVYTSSQKLIFVLPGRLHVYTVVAERSFFFFTGRPLVSDWVKRQSSFREDVYIRQ